MPAQYPMDIIASDIWKLTTPEPGAKEVKLPALATYESKWFYRLLDGATFYCPVTGGTTSGSSYPRSELREMKNGGKDKAAWSTGSGKHSMVVDLEVTALPDKKRHLVAGQIHGGGDDYSVFRFEGNTDPDTATLWITDGDNSHGYKVMDNYRLGTRIQLGFHIENGIVKYSVDGKFVDYELAGDKSGCYFKTGCYVQANKSNGAGHGEVILYSVQVCHDGQCYGNPPTVVGEPVEPEPPPVEPPTTPPTDGGPTLQDVNDNVSAVRQAVERLAQHLGTA